MSTVQVRDTTLYYERTGTGPPLLFIHGMCGDADVWRGQVDRLRDRFECITYDRRGHTRSELGSEPESVPTHVADAAALIDALGLSSPVVVGSSGGARIAVELAQTHPELLAGAVFSEPPIFSLDPVAGDTLMTDLKAAVGPAAGDASATVDAFFTALCPGLWAHLEESGKDRYRSNAPMLFAELSGPPYQLSVDDVGGIRLPSLVISGTISHPSLRTIASTLAKALPDARFIELTGSGHVTYAERPDEFARAVAAFAAEVRAGQRALG